MVTFKLYGNILILQKFICCLILRGGCQNMIQCKMYEKLLIQSNEVAHTNLSDNYGYISINIVPHFWWLWPGLTTIEIYWQFNCEFKEIGQAFCYVWQRCTNRDCCSIKYPSEVDLELRSREISILYYTRVFCISFWYFCTRHGSITAIRCGKYLVHNWSTESYWHARFRENVMYLAPPKCYMQA